MSCHKMNDQVAQPISVVRLCSLKWIKASSRFAPLLSQFSFRQRRHLSQAAATVNVYRWGGQKSTDINLPILLPVGVP